MSFLREAYAPPSVYTRTNFDSPLGQALEALKIPVFIGEGSEDLIQTDLEVVRGSSSTVDQRRVDEDETGRAVVSISATGVVTRGSFDGSLDRFQVQHFPIVTGDGTGTTSNSRTDVSVTINGQPIVVRAVTGATGIVQLAQAPKATDEVLCTYYFNRTDTLITDDLSEQVDPDTAVVRAGFGLFDSDSPGSVGGAGGGAETLDIHGDITDANGAVVVENNNTLNLVVDGVDAQIIIPPRSDYKMSQVASAITAAAKGTLEGNTFINHLGQSTLMLVSDHSIVVNEGTANGILGLLTGQADTRVATFYTFQGPIVTGDNGGVTTTDPSHVTVKVDGVQVIPTSVDGASRAVTLPVAPKAGATVAITYYFNSWQDTFDYLAHVGVQSVTRCGDVPGGSGYVQGADFILQDDKILWGTASTVESGVHSTGSQYFGERQVTLSLIDNRTFLSACTAVTTASGGVSVASTRDFQLPFSPTLGNGRNTPLGTSLYQTVANGRIDVAVNRPDVVWAYWGWNEQDALDRGQVEVLKVEGNVISLGEDVPVGATVYATFYYNQIVDEEYTLTCINPGLSGTGTYGVAKEDATSLYGAFFDTTTKGAQLTGVPIEFPSGSELTPDLRYETVSGSDFDGPVEEIVTVQFAAKVATLAKYTVPGYGPYKFIPTYSDHLAVRVRAVSIAGTAGLDLMNPSGHDAGFFASLVGAEIDYDGSGLGVAGESYQITTTQELVLEVDDADVEVSTGTSGGVAVDIGFFSDAINEAASGHQSTAAGGGAAAIILNAAARRDVLNGYVGWRVVIGNGAALATAGQFATVTAYNPTTGECTMDGNWAGGAVGAGDPYYIYNPDARSSMATATAFNGPVTLANNMHDKLRIAYTGDVSGLLTFEADLGNGPFATPAALATEVAAQIATVVALGVVGSPNHAGLAVEVVANADAALEFRLQLPGLDSMGYIQFIDAAGGAAVDFAVLAGLDTGTTNGPQAALLQCPVARTYEVPGAIGIGQKPYDRLILRNRLLPGHSGSMAAQNALSQTKLEVKVGNDLAGIETGDYGTAGIVATVIPATTSGEVGLLGGMDASAEPQVTFYDGSGTRPANDEFSFELDGNPVTVAFTSTDTGTVTPLGPASGASNGSILDQIIDAMAAVPGTPWGNAAAIFALGIVWQEGAGLRLHSQMNDTTSRITIGQGSANSLLGFSGGTVAVRTEVAPRVLASALMGNQNPASFANWMFNVNAALTSVFANVAIASVIDDAAGQEYLYMQDAPVLPANLGASSSIGLFDTFQSIANALRYDTGLDAESGDGAVGEASLNGFFVTSSNPNGSGSKNDSVLNDGVGADGMVGQTYRDVVTGLTFTILPRGWSTNQHGPWVAYPVGPNATFRFNCTKTFTTDANIPHNAMPGVEMRVANTESVAVGDTAIATSYPRGGNEPSIGDLYYTTYVYQKQDFAVSFYTKLSAIEQNFGPSTPDYPVSLAANLCILNGAVLIGIKQVLKATDSQQASLASYRAAIEDLEGVLPGQVLPDIITPLRGDSTELYQILKRSDAIQSSIRYKAERTSIVGVSAGTTPEGVQLMAQALGDTRMRVVYPDMATVSIVDQFNNISEELIDGTYVAAALAGSVSSPNLDVATPWTGRRLVGFTQLGRVLDAVEQNQIAVKGVTVMEDRSPFLRVRHGLSTDMSNILTKTPTVIMIADQVQQQSRVTLDSFVGIKFIPGVLSQVEGRLAMMLKAFVKAQIISAYTGVKATVDADDPTVANVEAFYSPVFPLLYLILAFHLRSSL